MTSSSQRILPLYHFFERLRINEFQLGIGEYQRFLIALHGRMGLTIDGYTKLVQAWSAYDTTDQLLQEFPKEQLLRLAKLLWLKPGQSVQVFEELFEECMIMDFPQKTTIKQPETTTTTPVDKQPDDKPVIPEEQETPTPQPSKTPTPQKTDDAVEEKTDTAVPVRLIALDTEETEKTLRLTQENEMETSKFLFTSNYYPIDRRKAQQNLKQISSYGYGQPSGEIDIDATIQRTVRQGFFSEAVFKKLKVNTTSLVMLIDGQGSMAAFEQLTNNIKTEAEEALMPNKKIVSKTMKTYYFYNVPGDYLYTNKTHTSHDPLSRVMGAMRGRSAGVIIISDAGAARGRYNPYRVKATRAFLKKMHACTSHIVWLNPFPKERWFDNSAEAIAGYVAMFEATEAGIKHAIDFLKGSTVKLLNRNEGTEQIPA
jgi:uncharacterized protein